MADQAAHQTCRGLSTRRISRSGSTCVTSASATGTWANGVIVENKGGASGAIGTAQVAQAPADGYTFGVVFDTHAVNPSLIPKLAFDAKRDLVSVILIGKSAMVLPTPVGSEFKTFADVVGAAKAKKNVSYGSIGSVFVNKPHIDSKKLSPLAVTTSKRSPDLPDVPTFAESGYVGFEAPAWWAVVASAKTPPDIVRRMNEELNKALKNVEVAKKLDQQGIDIVGGTSAQAQTFIDAQMVIWDKVVKDNNIKAE